jgi:hypothetical protein
MKTQRHIRCMRRRRSARKNNRGKNDCIPESHESPPCAGDTG